MVYRLVVTCYMACFQISPRRLLTADAMLNTIEVDREAFGASSSGVPSLSEVYRNVVVVTAEKTVATVVKLRRLVAQCRNVGTPNSEKS